LLRGPHENYLRSQNVTISLWEVLELKIYIFLILHAGIQYSSHELLNNLRNESEVQLLFNTLAQLSAARGTRGGYWEPASHIGAVASKLSQKHPRIMHSQGYCSIKGSIDDVFIYN